MINKLLLKLFILTFALFISSAGLTAERLHSWVSHELKKMEPILDKAEKQAAQGDMINAKVYMDSAEAIWKEMHVSLRDKFTDDHPEIVAMDQRLKAVSVKLNKSTVIEKPTVVQPVAAPSSNKLHPWVKQELNKIGTYLDKADSMAARGDIANAKTYLQSAQSLWEQMHDSMRDKFTDDQSEIVVTAQQLKSVKKLIASRASVQPQATQAVKVVEPTAPMVKSTPAATAPKPSGNTGPTITDALPSFLVRDMKNLNQRLDYLIQEAPTMDVGEVKKYFRGGNTTPWDEWETRKKWEQGKFHPQHPDIMAMDARMDKLIKLMEARLAQGDDARERLAVVLPVIMKNYTLLKEAHEQAKWKVQALGSSVSDGDANKLMKALDEVRLPVERVNALLPGAQAAVKDFTTQFPDMDEYDKLVDDNKAYGHGKYRDEKVRPEDAVNYVARFSDEWLQSLQYELKSALSEAEKNIKMYGLDRLAALKGKDKDLQQHAANSSEEHVIIFSSLLLETVDALLPELSAEDKVVLPKFVQARQEAMQKVKAMQADIAKVQTAVSKVRKNVIDAQQRKLEAARFPKSQYKGGEWSDAEKVIRKAFEAKIKDKKLLNISIYRPWEVRDEAKWQHDHWEISTYRYIGANCLAKLKNGKYMVYRMNFRNTRLADGKWSPLEQWSVGHVYEILKKNIDK